MRKFLMLLCVATLVFGMVGFAGAVSKTWTDIIDFVPDRYISDSYSYTHNITDGVDGFGEGDFVSSYSLSVELYDDGGFFDSFEIAYINQPGLFGDGFYNFSFTSQEYGWSLAGLIDLNLDGILNISIDSWWGGDFYLAKSTLFASGYGPTSAPVPEPATILLMGTGLLGLVAYSRKRFRQKS